MNVCNAVHGGGEGLNVAYFHLQSELIIDVLLNFHEYLINSRRNWKTDCIMWKSNWIFYNFSSFQLSSKLCRPWVISAWSSKRSNDGTSFSQISLERLVELKKLPLTYEKKLHFLQLCSSSLVLIEIYHIQRMLHQGPYVRFNDMKAVVRVNSHVANFTKELNVKIFYVNFQW